MSDLWSLVRSTTLIVVLGASAASPVGAAPTSSVTIAGDLNPSAMGCAVAWDPTCAAAHLVYDATDDVWQNTWTVLASSWQYKAALNDS